MAEEEHSEEVSGRYQLGRFLSKCSNGIFYEAKDSTTGEEVMVKKITEETFRWSTPEIEILNSLKHPNVIELKDSYSYDGSLHLVFERMNYSLKQIARDPNITVSLSNIKSYLEMILQGLSYCHGKWISHRNLRLKNLFIAHDGTLKLADFGYARKLDTRTGPEIDITAVGNVFAKLVLSREDCMVNQGFTTGKKFIHRLSFMFRQLEREAIQLLRKICQTRYVFSAKQALEHPYFTSYPPPTNPSFLSKPVLDLKKDIDALSALGPHIYKVDAKFEKVSIGETSGTSGEKSEEPEKDQPAAGSWIRMGKLIGKGSFGSVYEGEDTTTGEKFAVKTGLPGSHALISLRTSVTEMKMYQILQENNFQHKNIIKCLGGWENHEYNLFLTFELMETELFTIIRKEVYLSRGQVKAYLLMMLQGLEYCHSKQIIHRDIKPNNLLQSHDGHLKLADFGRACRFMQYDAFDPCDICNYMFRAPELFLSREGYGPAIDIWSAGCVFAEMIQKKRIFQGESDTDVLDKIFQLLGSNRIPNWNDWLSKYPNFRGTWYDEKPIIEFVTKGTEDALDLLSRMLVYDPSQRISAKDALAHRYFQTEPEPADPSELPGSTMSKALQKALRELAALPDSDSEGGS